MKKLATLAIRLMASIDCIIGMLVYLTCSFIFHEPWNWKIFIFSLFMAHLPDFDLVPYLIIRKKMRIPSHWLIGHHPLIVIPLGIIIAVVTALVMGLNIKYLTVIAGSGVSLHFIHDSIQKQGLHWFSPFSWERYTLYSGFPRKVSQWFWVYFVARARSAQRNTVPHAAGEVTRRIAGVSLVQWIVWFCAVSAVIEYATTS